ncbi:hypothetical protein [Pseudoxanthomonas sp. SE1]|uniref:hypothetical protein n=1 Tax=Pseudoxanthomonas sp. SE1 TaxID=1664560 RepID=UPI00240DA244|nr:hypothetical protein [Pseudoxanthomonas sp. SE1]WFC43779.1 hypothetical protein OY559_09910 [Pseudoxanthomonas sp. SE1]
MAGPDGATFTDFLTFFVCDWFGNAWIEQETTKPIQERHPVAMWKAHLDHARKNAPVMPGGDYSFFPISGFASAFFRLGNDLLTITANDSLIKSPQEIKRINDRLRTKSGFISARQEIAMAAAFLRGGFEIEWEDETDGSSQHGEFLAHWRKNRTFIVECRMKQPDNLGPVLRRWRTFGTLFTSALEKRLRVGGTRVVCIDLNLAPAASQEELVRRLRAATKSIDHISRLPEHAALPPAVVVFSDLPDRHSGESLKHSYSGAVHVFKHSEYPYMGSGRSISSDESLSAMLDGLRLQATIPHRFALTDESHPYEFLD